MNLYQSLIIISMATGLGVSIELLSTELKITKELLAKYFNQCNKCAQKMPDGFQFQEDGTCGAIELFPHAVCVTSSDNEVVEFHIDVDLEKANHSLKSKMIEEFDDAISFFELLFGVSSRWKKVNQYTQLREKKGRISAKIIMPKEAVSAFHQKEGLLYELLHLNQK